jgi:hypothetical protein
MIDALPPERGICDCPLTCGDINDAGVISYPEGCRNPVYARGTSLDAFLSAHHTGRAFTLETPTGWPLRDRVDTHLTLVATPLRSLRESG